MSRTQVLLLDLLSFSLGAGPSTLALAPSQPHSPTHCRESPLGSPLPKPLSNSFPALDGGNPERPGDAESGLYPGCGEPGRVAGGLPPAAGYV